MPKRLTITLYDDVPEAEALAAIRAWFLRHSEDPAGHPMTGVVVMESGVGVARSKPLTFDDATEAAISALEDRDYSFARPAKAGQLIGFYSAGGYLGELTEEGIREVAWLLSLNDTEGGGP